MLCDCELAAGQEAIWHRELRRVTCLACTPAESPVAGTAGASALREYERRRQRRKRHARDTLGGFGVVLSRVIDEPSTTKVWKQGGNGEVRAGARLEKHLAGTGVSLLHDRRISRHEGANIDHLAIGPGGVTVIDTKTHRGNVKLDRVGGLFAPRRTVLIINGRDRTGLIEGVERQIGYVKAALRRAGIAEADIRGALCFAHPDGLPLFRQLSVRDVVIDGPKPVAKLAARSGPLSAAAVERIFSVLGLGFPPA